jgi:hypothetical protein
VHVNGVFTSNDISEGGTLGGLLILGHLFGLTMNGRLISLILTPYCRPYPSIYSSIHLSIYPSIHLSWYLWSYSPLQFVWPTYSNNQMDMKEREKEARVKNTRWSRKCNIQIPPKCQTPIISVCMNQWVKGSSPIHYLQLTSYLPVDSTVCMYIITSY